MKNARTAAALRVHAWQAQLNVLGAQCMLFTQHMRRRRHLVPAVCDRPDACSACMLCSKSVPESANMNAFSPSHKLARLNDMCKPPSSCTFALVEPTHALHPANRCARTQLPASAPF
eukprot:3567358-Pleurochrysis_carterae.AAC.1